MSVMRRRPFVLFVSKQSEPYEDENGHYHSPTETWVKCKRCDVIPATSGESVINTEDGRTETYQYEVIFDLPVRDFSYGERVQIHGSTEHQGRIYKVIWKHSYQHQYKLRIGYDGN